MAAYLKNKLNFEHIELQKSSGGRFEVYLNSDKIYSKIESMRFPDPEEIVDLLKSKLKE